MYSRSTSTKLGANGRDNLFSVGRYCYEGSNRVVLTGVDSRPFALIIYTASTRSVDDVKALMKPMETLEKAHARVKHLLRGGDGADSDDEIECLSTVISLKCPLTGMRVKVRNTPHLILRRLAVEFSANGGSCTCAANQTPARFADVSGLNVFDLEAFLDIAQKTYKWQCPQTMKNSSIEVGAPGKCNGCMPCMQSAGLLLSGLPDTQMRATLRCCGPVAWLADKCRGLAQHLQVDSYIQRALELLEPTSYNEIEVSPEGHWRPAGTEEEFRDIQEDLATAKPFKVEEVRPQQQQLCHSLLPALITSPVQLWLLLPGSLHSSHRAAGLCLGSAGEGRDIGYVQRRGGWGESRRRGSSRRHSEGRAAKGRLQRRHYHRQL